MASVGVRLGLGKEVGWGLGRVKERINGETSEGVMRGG